MTVVDNHVEVEVTYFGSSAHKALVREHLSNDNRSEVGQKLEHAKH